MNKEYSSEALKEIAELFTKDQNNISKYNIRLLTKEDFILRQMAVGTGFLNIINKNGFPYKNIVGYKCYKQAVTIALHSNPENMKIYADIFSKINDPLKIDLSDKAYFIDKLRLMEKKPQVYGTQYTKNPDRTITFKEIEDIENVDERRKSLGMGTLEEYRRFAEGK